jgi:hypothetical protein
MNTNHALELVREMLIKSDYLFLSVHGSSGGLIQHIVLSELCQTP